MIKPITIFLLLMPLLSMVAEKNEPSAVDKKAAALEAQLNKSLDTSVEGAKVMIELVDLYYNEGRVFGLVRVSDRFVKAQSRHAQHRQVMLKLVDGLEVMGRRDELITIGRQYLARYPDSTEALDVALRVSDGLERNRKRSEAADVLRLLWEHKPGVGNRKAAERASELYGQEGNTRLRIRSAQLCESMMEKLPASPYTVRAGFRAITEYRAISRWAESNQAAQKLIQKRLSINRIQQFELHHLMAQSYASQSQWANAVESMRKARSFKDDSALYAAQISYMHNAGFKPQQIENEARGLASKFPNDRRRWEVLLYVGHAHARENNHTLAAGSIQPALANAANSGNMAYYYVLWMVDEANAARGKTMSAQAEGQKNLENAKTDEKSKRDAFNKAGSPEARNAAQTALVEATKLVQRRQQEFQKAQASARDAETEFRKQVTDSDRALITAVGKAKASENFGAVLALRYSLARTLYRERVKD